MSIHKSKEDWNATYIGSFVSMDKLPTKKIPSIAIIGRSNVGKSSLINALCNQKGIARVSSSPGKTQQLNFYEVNEKFYFVDMPGYGYAKVSKDQRGEWASLKYEFLRSFESLLTVVLLIDANIPMQSSDADFIEWCGENQIPFVIVRTKCDKSKPLELNKLQNEFEAFLSESWEELPVIIRQSSIKKTGTDELKKVILNIIKNA